MIIFSGPNSKASSDFPASRLRGDLRAKSLGIYSKLVIKILNDGHVEILETKFGLEWLNKARNHVQAHLSLISNVAHVLVKVV